MGTDRCHAAIARLHVVQSKRTMLTDMHTLQALRLPRLKVVVIPGLYCPAGANEVDSEGKRRVDV